MFSSGCILDIVEFEVSLVQLEIFYRLNSMNLKWRCKSGVFAYDDSHYLMLTVCKALL